MELTQKIRNSPLGVELSDQQAEVLAGLAEMRQLADGQYLIEQGANDSALHVIISGRLEVTKKTGVGDDINLHVLREGDLAGELSFIDDMQHTLGLRALGDCEVFSIKRQDFQALINREPELVYKVMCAIMRSVHRIVHRMNHQHMELTNYITKQHGRY